MKQTWTLFVGGLFIVLSVAVFLKRTQAETESATAKPVNVASETPSASVVEKPAEKAPEKGAEKASEPVKDVVAKDDAKDPHAPKRIEDPSISGIKTEVPSGAELEATLQAKAKELQDKESRIKESQDRLAAEEARLKIRISELESLQQELQVQHDKNNTLDETILAKMVKTFETMQPKKAAGVLATMRDNLAVDILLKMKEKKLAAVMESMDPTRATSLSTLMSSRRPAAAASNGDSGPGAAQGAGLAPKN